ncbi:MAG: hypothetical protein ACREQM_01375 [Candidatus Dormibacteraceae bacterium]
MDRLAALEPAAVRDFIKGFEKLAATGFNVGRPAESDLAGFRYVIGNLQALYDEDPPYLRVVLVEDARQRDAHS